MGIAVLSGVLDALASPSQPHQGSDSGASTPVSSQLLDANANSTPDRFIACVGRDESARKLRRLWKEAGHDQKVSVRADDNVRSVEEADVVLLACVSWSPKLVSGLTLLVSSCKPQMAESIMTVSGMYPALEGKLVISILAGTTTAQLQAWVPSSTRVVRAMPNTPCKVSQSLGP